MKNDVLVVGGGLAGLTAAYKLQGFGLKVKVIEKETQVGGRTASFMFDTDISVGAEFLTPKYAHTIALCKNLGVELVPKKAMYTIQFGNSDWKFGYSQALRWIYQVGLVNLLKNLGASHKLVKTYRTNIFDQKKLMESFDVNFDQFVKRVSLPQEMIDLMAAVNRLTFHYNNGLKEISTAFLISWVKNILGGKYLMPKSGMSALSIALTNKLDVETGVEVLSVKKQKGNWELASSNKTYTGQSMVLATPANISAYLLGKELKNVSQITNLLKNSRYSTLRRIYVKVAKPVGKLSFVYVQDDKNNLVEYYSQVTPHLTVFKLRPQIFDNKVNVDNLFKSVGVPLQGDRILMFDSKLDYALPVFDVEHIKHLIKFQKSAKQLATRNRIVFAGDYLFGPFAESAVYSGIKAAELIVSIYL